MNKNMRFKKRFDILTPVQVSKLADKEAYEIAQNYKYKDLEQMLITLTNIYDSILVEKEKLMQNRVEQGNEARSVVTQGIEEQEGIDGLSNIDESLAEKARKRKSKRKTKRFSVLRLPNYKKITLKKNETTRTDSLDISASRAGSRNDTSGGVSRENSFNLFSEEEGQSEMGTFSASNTEVDSSVRKYRRKSKLPNLKIPTYKKMTLRGSRIGKTMNTFSRNSRISANSGKKTQLFRKRGTRIGKKRRESVFRLPNLQKFRNMITPEQKGLSEDVDITLYSTYDLEKALEKCDKAMRTHSAYKQKQKEKWTKWERKQLKANQAALDALLPLIPKNLKSMKIEDLIKELDNKYLARRFLRNKVFLVFLMTPKEISGIHPVDLKNRYHFTALDLNETRALYLFTDGLKRDWRKALRDRLFSLIERQEKGHLPAREVRSPAYDGKPDFDEENKNPSKRRQSVLRTLKGGNKGMPVRRASVMVAKELELLRKNPSFQKQEDLDEIKKEAEEIRKPSIKKNKVKKHKSKVFNGEMENDRVKSFYTEGLMVTQSQYIRQNDLVEELSDEEAEREDLLGKKRRSLEKDFPSSSDGEKNGEHQRQLSLEFENIGEGYGDESEEFEAKEAAAPGGVLLEALQMITSDDIKEDDERFLNTLRKLSNFSSTLDEFDNYIEEAMLDDEDFADDK
eukprot:snap_masked-scaffold_10-processed-gene-11.15-mRNA-1 protein AED:1.00 eAED:1.00 QI:0/-1/0/0/-1/1/1/0/681